MASTIALSVLRTQCRQRADMENSTFITDAELNNYINNSYAELYDMLVQAYGEEYFIKETADYTLTSGDKTYNINTIVTDDDFYKLRGVDYKLTSNDYTELKKHDFRNRNKSAYVNSYGSNLTYRIMGDVLYFEPAPSTGDTIKLWYVPIPVVLSADGDTINKYGNWYEYIVIDCAIKMREKEESDTIALERAKEKLIKRIEAAAQNRDIENSEVVEDVNVFYWDDV